MMKRRSFINKSLLSTLGVAGIVNTAFSFDNNQVNTGKPFNLDFAFHDGMFKNHGGTNFTDQIKWAYDQGFRSIEDNGMLSRNIQQQEEIGSLLGKLGMKMGVFVLTDETGWHWKTSLASGKTEFIDNMKKNCQKAIEAAKRVNAKHITVVPGNFERSLHPDVQTANVITALKIAAEILEPHGLIMVLEPLSDNSDLFLRFSQQTYMICKAVDSPSCKILYDIYHMQRNEGNLVKNIDTTWSEIAYIQIGDNPGRKEPTTGEINFTNVFKHIHSKGYKGVYGMEHGKSKEGKEGEIALINAYRSVDLKV
jgi:hydroxypyruvate isomerase